MGVFTRAAISQAVCERVMCKINIAIGFIPSFRYVDLVFSMLEACSGGLIWSGRRRTHVRKQCASNARAKLEAEASPGPRLDRQLERS